MRTEDRPSPEQVMTVIGLAAHTHRLGNVVAMLVDQGYEFEAAATVRAAYEAGLTAHWVAQHGDNALLARLREDQRKRKNLSKTIDDMSAFLTLRNAEDVQRLLAENIDIPGTGADDGARWFDKLCGDLELGTAYYFGYRVLSDQVHPSLTVVGAYVESTDPVAMRLEPAGLDGSITALATTCCALIWAAWAADMLSADRPRRAFLGEAAAVLGISPELPLTAEARDRPARQEKSPEPRPGGRRSRERREREERARSGGAV